MFAYDFQMKFLGNMDSFVLHLESAISKNWQCTPFEWAQVFIRIHNNSLFQYDVKWDSPFFLPHENINFRNKQIQMNYSAYRETETEMWNQGVYISFIISIVNTIQSICFRQLKPYIERPNNIYNKSWSLTWFRRKKKQKKCIYNPKYFKRN